ncbi:MAG: hypothetical protein NTZ05_16705 [Chloroflexi bacterium]|nr:hypothetical protein [Chloroflexota bacterium]
MEKTAQYEPNPHVRAMALADQGNYLSWEGRQALAVEKWLAAAMWERHTLDDLLAQHPERHETTGIIAVSYVTLLYRAGAYPVAQREAWNLINHPDIQLPAWYVAQLIRLREAMQPMEVGLI